MKTFLHGNWRYAADDNPDFAHPGHDDSAWAQMSLPANWFLGGLDAHGVVWFRREFDYQPGGGPFVRLHFDGVDYFAEVYLNGTRLGRHSGYFDPFSFDVTGVLVPGRNLLAVRVDSPYETPGLDGWHLRKKLIKGVLNHHDCRPGGGWEPVGQSFNTGGIWNRVYLEEHGAVTLEGFLLRADLESDPPVLHAELRVENRGPARAARLALHCQPDNFSGEEYSGEFDLALPSGASVHPIRLPVPGARRWQPWDRGFPHLYRVTAALADARTDSLFGFRSVRLDPGYRFILNGEPYFLRGSNYLPSQWLAETLFAEANSERHPFGGGPGPGTFDRDVRLARACNLNILRVHAHVLPPEFYEACDRAGLLVWQDFALQWGYSDEPAFQEEAVRQMRAMVTMLSNHPSIVIWCCHNESPWDAPWMAGAAGGLYDPAHNRDLDARLEAETLALDPTRPVHRNSGTGDGHAYPGWYFSEYTLFRDLPGAPLVTEYGAQALPGKESLLRTFARLGPDAGYADLMRFKAFLRARSTYKPLPKPLLKFMSALINHAERLPLLKPLVGKINAWGMNAETSYYKRLPPEEEIPAELRPAYETWQAWRFHDFQPPETFEEGRLDPGESLDAFIASSQDYQARLLQFGTEVYRRAKGRVTGLFQFDFTDPWPAVTWSVLDYWRQPKAGYAALQRAMQPVLPSLDLPDEIRPGKGFRAPLVVVNDLNQAFPAVTCAWRLDGNGRLLAQDAWQADLPANAVKKVHTFLFPALPPGEHRLTVTVTAAEGKVLGENLYILKV